LAEADGYIRSKYSKQLCDLYQNHKLFSQSAFETCPDRKSQCIPISRPQSQINFIEKSNNINYAAMKMSKHIKNLALSAQCFAVHK